VIAVISWLAFGSDSWHAFLHWMPAFSQAAFTDGLATWFKLQSVFGLVRYLGGGEPLAWTLQWMMSGTIVVVLVMAWRSRLPYALKAAALATATLLVSPYLFLYDEMVLAIPVALLVRTGLADGFPEYELPALGCVALLLLSFPWVGAPVGLGATLIVAVLIVRRAFGPRTTMMSNIASPWRYDTAAFQAPDPLEHATACDLALRPRAAIFGCHGRAG
jgi:hypothetical protein